jgi:hypothetical protein
MGFIKGREFFYWLNDYQLSKKELLLEDTVFSFAVSIWIKFESAINAII